MQLNNGGDIKKEEKNIIFIFKLHLNQRHVITHSCKGTHRNESQKWFVNAQFICEMTK